ncbi:hypothetical protein ACWE42_02780 [Sutcliffiella cohnii]|nr:MULTISPECIES: hypothetical protein [Sutcliffiella]MED4015159.1 hypothetical protein [Sutcliffiella cohnii]WBL13119.1 hypothetical protein O1A01_14365 [Sutcliffiella sp. NC1]
MRTVALPKVYLRELTLEDAEDTKPSAFFVLLRLNNKNIIINNKYLL